MNQNFEKQDNSLYELDMECLKEQENVMYRQNNELTQMGFNGNCGCERRECREEQEWERRQFERDMDCREERREERQESRCERREERQENRCERKQNCCGNNVALFVLLLLFCQ